MESGKIFHGWFRRQAAKLSGFKYFYKWGNRAQRELRLPNFRLNVI